MSESTTEKRPANKKSAEQPAQPSFDEMFGFYDRMKEAGLAELRAAKDRVLEIKQKLEQLGIHDPDEPVPTFAREPARRGGTRTTRHASEGGERAGRGENQRLVHDLLAKEGQPLSRGEILEKLGLKGTQKESSISAALAQMKKSNAVVHHSDGKYSLPTETKEAA